MARNLKNLADDYDDDDDEIGGIRKITHRPKFNSRNDGYTKDNREIQKKRREKDKMRKASIKQHEDDNE